MFSLPAGYIGRSTAVYFDDRRFLASEMIYQPEIYEAADYLLRADGRRRIVDIGCGNGRKLRGIRAEDHIGIDFGANLALCRELYGSWGTWIEADFSDASCLAHANLARDDTVVVCADVIEHLLDPMPLVRLLAAFHRQGAIVLTSTPDRLRVRGAAHMGPPDNPAHVREWALDEYSEFLSSHGLPPVYSGYTVDSNLTRQLKTIVTIHDSRIIFPYSGVLRSPLAILIVAGQVDETVEFTVDDLLHEGCDIQLIYNGFSDNAWENWERYSARLPPSRVTVSRSASGRIAGGDEALSAASDCAASGRWIFYTKPGDILRSPFLGQNLAQSLHLAGSLGATEVSFCGIRITGAANEIALGNERRYGEIALNIDGDANIVATRIESLTSHSSTDFSKSDRIKRKFPYNFLSCSDNRVSEAFSSEMDVNMNRADNIIRELGLPILSAGFRQR